MRALFGMPNVMNTAITQASHESIAPSEPLLQRTSSIRSSKAMSFRRGSQTAQARSLETRQATGLIPFRIS